MQNWKKALLTATGTFLTYTSIAFGIGCKPNPVINYAKEKNLPNAVVREFKSFGEDGIMDENEKALIEEYASLPKSLQISEKVLNYLKEISLDKKVTNHELYSFSDFDRDGLKNSEELKYGTDLFSNDTDKDNLTDKDEVLLYKTNPLIKDTDKDGLTDWEEVIIYKTEPLIPNPAVRYAFDKNFEFYSTRIDVLKGFEKDGVLDDNERWLIDIIPNHAEFDKLAKVVQKDGKTDDREKEFFNLAIEYYPKLNQLFPGFYGEIAYIPTLSTIEEEDIKAVKNILQLATNPKYKVAFESMLKEGVPRKRKYSTPLEALFWIAYDDGLKPYDLEYYSLENLITKAWRNTTTSNNYKSERWKDFDEVIDRLNSPYLVNIWVRDNLAYDFTKAKSDKPLIQYVLQGKKGVCRHVAAFATECLTQAGYKVKNFTVLWEDAGGHTIAVEEREKELWIVMDFRESGPIGIKGPYKSYDDIARYVAGLKRIRSTFIEDNYRLLARNSEPYR